jgi:alkylmercury lyase
VTGHTFAEAKAAWATQYAGLSQEEIDQRVAGFSILVRGIAKQGAVTSEEFAREAELTEEEVSRIFSGLATLGMQFDEAGKVVGAALTTLPTPHRVSLGGKDLFAWCALDTLFIPGLLDQAAEVESTCPVSNSPVRLTVTPDGVQSVSPPETVVSVILPGMSSIQSSTGPASPT